MISGYILSLKFSPTSQNVYAIRFMLIKFASNYRFRNRQHSFPYHKNVLLEFV